MRARPLWFDCGPRATHFDRHCRARLVGRTQRRRRKRCPTARARSPCASFAPQAPPVIDGVLDEEAWQLAAQVEDLHEIQPTEYAPASERTVVYLMYDSDALYIGARLYDQRPERDHGAHPAPRRAGIRRRLVLGAARPVPRSAQRLSLHDESERPAARRTVPEHQRGAVGLGRHLVHGLDDRRAGLGHRDRDSVQDAVVRPEQRHVGHQLPPRDRAARRAHGLGLAQPQLRSQHVGHGRRPHRTRAGRRSRHRAVAVRQRTPAVRRHGVDDGHRSVARPVLQDHAEPHGRVDDQHGFLGHRGRRSTSQLDALRPVLPREARLLPPGRRHLRVRRVGRERPAVLLAPYRLERRRNADRPRSRRQAHGARWAAWNIGMLSVRQDDVRHGDSGRQRDGGARLREPARGIERRA